MLSPALVHLNHDAFTVDEQIETTVDLEACRGMSNLDELDLGEARTAEGA
jgi:hypothetical protein